LLLGHHNLALLTAVLGFQASEPLAGLAQLRVQVVELEALCLYIILSVDEEKVIVS